MVSDFAVMVFGCMLVAITCFVMLNIRKKNNTLLRRLFLALLFCYAAWILPLIGMHFTDPSNTEMMFIWDCLMQPGGNFSPAVCLCIAMAFVNGEERMTKAMKLTFVIPALTILVCITNPLHHLQYRVFSVVRSEIEFGPFIVISGCYSYVCLTMAIATMMWFAIKNRSKLYMKQCILVSLGEFCPLVISTIVTFLKVDMPITATPLSFSVTLLLNGFAIYRLHFLDIRPIAMTHVLEYMSDGFLLVSKEGLVISCNKRFTSLFASKYGIIENRFLKDCVKKEDVLEKTAIYNIITAIESSREAKSAITYEQAMMTQTGDEATKSYYVVDVSPLILDGTMEGFVVLFKDVTQIKRSMQQLQKNRERMMEQERLAFLGQMIGGLAHNLKTPIMGVSGCISAAEDLLEECEESLGDPEVVEEDYREIYGEMRNWFSKMRESAAYMSDIITAIKGQAANVVTDDDRMFTVSNMIKRSLLLMRHELQSGSCLVREEYELSGEIMLNGDINNLIQVMNNLMSNAIYAQRQVGGGTITILVGRDEENLLIKIKDTGVGVSPTVRDKVFKEMITNKGNMGTGLGLYISNAVVRGKFGGSLWMEDNPGGGSIFGIAIPLERVKFTDSRKNEEEAR